MFELRDRRASQTRRAEPTRARPKPPSREVRLASGAHVSRGRGASGNRSGKPARLACCVVLFSRVTHRTSGRDGSPGRGREARRDLHVRGSMADLRHGMECASPETPPRARRALTPNQHANADAHRAIGAISRAPPTWRQRHTRKPPSATDCRSSRRTHSTAVQPRRALRAADLGSAPSRFHRASAFPALLIDRDSPRAGSFGPAFPPRDREFRGGVLQQSGHHLAGRGNRDVPRYADAFVHAPVPVHEDHVHPGQGGHARGPRRDDRGLPARVAHQRRRRAAQEFAQQQQEQRVLRAVDVV